MKASSDLELLGIQAAGTFDHRGRIIDTYGIAIVCTAERHACWIGADVPDTQATELTAAVDAAPPSSTASEPPAVLERCRRILEAGGIALEQTGGPHFAIPDDAQFPSDARIERSDGPPCAALRTANPGNWHPVEWHELLDGRLGPWTMALDADRVVSICHTPGPITARGAECGVWTQPGFRGRGLAAAVTAAWAAMMRPSGRPLFYSTDAGNRSSQNVARRLRLRPLGWIWHLRAVREPAGDRAHPLCSLYRIA